MMKKPALFFLTLFFSLQVFTQPIIKSFSPTFGAIATTVTIQGTNFNTTPTQNIVYFGAVKSVVSAATDTTLKVIVPTGATFRPITVTTNNLTAYSINSFNTIFSGSSGPFTPTSFLPKTDLATGNYPHSVTFGDLNSDGKTDLLVSKGSSASVAVFANASTNGAILFGIQQDLPALGNSHEGSATGDLDGDGKLDIVITNSFNSPSVSVYRNTSTGAAISFAPNLDYPADNGPYNVAIGDIDSDGKPDLIVANTGSNVISFYKNTGTPGTIGFAARMDFNAGTSPYSVAINDLDGDGKPDIAVSTQSSGSALSVMRNTTSGGIASFDAPVYLATLSGSFIVSIGDLDDDGKPDLAAASSSSNSIVVVKNISSPGALSFYTPQSFATGIYPVCVSLTDLDGDGKPDMITANQQSNNISTLRNISTLGNISFESHVDYAAGEHPIFVAAADLDGDGRPDIVNANSSADAVSVYRNIMGANIAPVISSFTPDSGINGTTVTILGFNFTGATSVKFGGTEAASFTVHSANSITAIAGAGASGNVSVTTANGIASLAGFVYEGPIINSFTPTVGVAGTIVTITGVNFTGVTSVKFGGTQASSFIIVSAASITANVGAGATGDVTVTTPNGTATLPGFSYGVPKITSFTPLSGFIGSTVTITGKNFSTTPTNNIVFFGAVKALVSQASATQLSVIVPAGAIYKPISVTTNNLTAFSSKAFIPGFESDSTMLSTDSYSIVANYGTGLYPWLTNITDLNDDGKPDLITANAVGNTISVFQNTTSGILSFNFSTVYASGPDPKQVASGDLDGDGKPDIGVIHFNSGNASTMAVFRNTSTGGNIAFAAKQDYNTGNGSADIAIADMNGDGKADVIVASGNSGFFSIFKNTTTAAGTISFAAKQDVALLARPDRICIVDVDDDGRPDLVTSNLSNESISIFRNQSAGGNFSLATRIDYTTGSHPTYLATGDMDGDGKTDIMVPNFSSGDISFFKNNSTIGAVSFSPASPLQLAVSNISVAELNGDGKLDLFAGRGLTGNSSILQNTFTNNGSFSFAPNIDFTTGNYDAYVNVGDLDGDGRPELIVNNTLLNTISILKSTIGRPVITSLSIDSGSTNTSVIINGKNFTGVTMVSFGGSAASFTIISSTKIIAVISGGASGDVVVANATTEGRYPGFKFIPQISANGPLNFCNGQSVLLTSTAFANNQWYKDGGAISGATSNTLDVNKTGTYSVMVNSSGIITSNDTDVVITVTTLPTPLITKIVNINLTSNVATGNQWYLNGSLIPGATNQLYIPAKEGSYSVQTHSNGCTSDFSLPYIFALTGVINLGNGEYIDMYPNPVKDRLYIHWNIPGMAILSVQINDVKGTPVFVNNAMQTGNSINVSMLPPGIYFIKFYSSQLNINNTTAIIKE